MTEIQTQRKNTTLTGKVIRKANKILSCMSSFPEGITPKELARQTGLNVNTIKAILNKLDNVTKVMRGVYKVVNGGDAPLPSSISNLKTWNFHNCHLTTTIPNFTGRFTQTTHSLKLINLKFIISSVGKVTLRLSSDYPLNVSSLCMVAGFMNEQLNKHGHKSVLFSDITVSTIEFNKDYSNLRLDGVKCITLDNLCEQFKVYQKKLGLRIEHKTKVKFNVENVVDMLATDPNSLELNIKLAKQKEQLDRLAMATSNHTKLLFKLIDTMKEMGA